jgi:hypothetical protein
MKRQTSIKAWACCKHCELAPCLWIQIGEQVVKRCNEWEVKQESVVPNDSMNNWKRRENCFEMCSHLRHVSTRMESPRSHRHGDYGGTRACIKEWVWKIYPDDSCRRVRFGRIFGEGVYPRTKKKKA